MGDRVELSTKMLAKAIERLHAAAAVRRQYLRGTPEHEQALAEEEHLSDVVMEIAKVIAANLAAEGRGNPGRNEAPTVRRSSE